MLNRSIRFFIENKLVTFLLLILIIGWGVVFAPFGWDIDFLPRNPVAVDALPDIGENQQIVFTEWKGNAPQDIEDQITYPLTTYLLGIPGVKTIRSSSMFGFSSIYIIFEDGVEFYWSRSRILEKLNSIPSDLLPQGVKPTLGPDATALGQIFWYTVEGRDEKGNATGGWDLHELRSIQDYYIKYSLSSAHGVAEVASIGGYVKEYQIDVHPELMRQYNISLQQIVRAVKESNQDIGAQTIEINNVEYVIRGLGYFKSTLDIENTWVHTQDFVPIRLKDIANVTIGPATRRGILDKAGVEAVGGVVVARFGANPREVIQNIKRKIEEMEEGMPFKTLENGTKSKLTIIPFYDRTQLINETLNTLKEALTLEILITFLVIIIMLFNLRASLLIASLLPIAILIVFIAMKGLNVDANILALSGIAIAIGTMVDMGVILSENIIRHLDQKKNIPINKVVYNATKEVSGAIVTAVLTTIISFIPIFTMIGAEGKLFRPLAFTKTFALAASLLVALFIIPPLAALVFQNRKPNYFLKLFFQGLLFAIGILALIFGLGMGILLVALACVSLLQLHNKISKKQSKFFTNLFCVMTIVIVLTQHWRPLGVEVAFMGNLGFVIGVAASLLGFFTLFLRYYTSLLRWCFRNKALFLSIPLALVCAGLFIFNHMGKEFMPSLNEGSFLLMPTSMPHTGVEENKRILQQLDLAVANIPEIQTVVGKAGRTESALDPAPMSMFENSILYKPEYMLNDNGEKQRYKINKYGLYETKEGRLIANPNTIKDAQMPTILPSQLIEDDDGAFYRNWRPEIKTPDDIWNQIVKVTQLPGVTSAPKLQPIETRLVMLQSGMRSPMGIKILGQDIKEIEGFGKKVEALLKQVEGIESKTVFADRLVGKPYLQIVIDREKIAQYEVSLQDVQNTIKVAVGGEVLTKTVEGRERYGVRVRYPRDLRTTPSDIQEIYIPMKNGNPIPLSQLATIRYEPSPQVIKSENTFLVGYVLFDKQESYSEWDVVENAKKMLQEKIETGQLEVPKGISFSFAGNYQNQLRADKTLAWVVPMSLVVIFIILYFQFRSLSTSLLVFSGVAVAFAGGFILLWLYGEPWFLNIDFFGENIREWFQIETLNMSVAVWVGFIALFGIATDDGVLMATHLMQTFKKNTPKTKNEIRQAVVQAGEKRIRPCLMTTATTILALLPILTSTGRGSDLMIPMAIPCFGGMLVALLSLFVVPVLYGWKAEMTIKIKEK